jgi:putative DNA-invertase from lambdoid prophage Rac
MKRAAIYVRVSTAVKARNGAENTFEQNPAVQEQPLRALAEQRGWSIARVYSDRMSGAKADRPGFNALMKDARRGLFDLVLVWRLDRWGRSVPHLLATLQELVALGIGFVSLTEALDLTTPAGRAMAGLLAIFAEFEREILRERVQAGLEYARQHGTKSGKAIGRPRRVFDREKVRALRQAGLSIEKIALQMGLGVGTVVRVLRDAADDSTAFHNPSPRSVGPGEK